MNNKKNLETTGQRLVVLFCKGSDGMVFHVNNHIWRLEFVRPDIGSHNDIAQIALFRKAAGRCK